MNKIAVLPLLLTASLARAEEPRFDFKVDPAVELLGVVERLAGRAPGAPSLQDYARAVDRRFAPFRDHPAVKLYEDLASDSARYDACSILPFYYSAPPELALKDRSIEVPPLPAADLHRFV